MLGGCGLDLPGSGEGLVVGCYEHGDEPLGSGTMELGIKYSEQQFLGSIVVLYKPGNHFPL
jgi:hypothetical protein